MKKLFTIIVSVIALLGLSTLTATATGAKLEQSAEITGDCGEVTLTFVNNHKHATKDFTYVWNIQASDGQNFNVSVANSAGSVTTTVTLAEGEGSGWVSYGVVAGPESDYYLANETINVDLCEPEPIEVTPEAPTLSDVCDGPQVLNIPTVEGVIYDREDGEEVGYEELVVVKATPAEGYAFTESAETTWSLAGGHPCPVDEDPEPEPDPTTEPPTEPQNDKDGKDATNVGSNGGTSNKTTSSVGGPDRLPDTGTTTTGLLVAGGLTLLGGGLLAVRRLGILG